MSILPASAFIGLRGLVAWECNKPRVLWQAVTLYGWHSYLFIAIYYWVCKYPSAKQWKPFVIQWVWDFWVDHWQCRVQQLTVITKPSSLSEMCIWECQRHSKSVSFLNVWVYFSQTDYTDALKCQCLPVPLAQRSISQPVRMQTLIWKSRKQTFQISRGCAILSKLFAVFKLSSTSLLLPTAAVSMKCKNFFHSVKMCWYFHQ